MLKLNVNPMQRRWTEVQELLGQAIIRVGEEVLDENLHIECKLSPIGVDGHQMGQRGSSRRYDSVLGCSVAFGLRSSLPIEIEAMSTFASNVQKGQTTIVKKSVPKTMKAPPKGSRQQGQ
jgi:hypothetical protein